MLFFSLVVFVGGCQDDGDDSSQVKGAGSGNGSYQNVPSLDNPVHDADKVSKKTNGEQVPWQSASLTGKILFWNLKPRATP